MGVFGLRNNVHARRVDGPPARRPVAVPKVPNGLKEGSTNLSLNSARGFPCGPFLFALQILTQSTLGKIRTLRATLIIHIAGRLLRAAALAATD